MARQGAGFVRISDGLHDDHPRPSRTYPRRDSRFLRRSRSIALEDVLVGPERELNQCDARNARRPK
jgi:hypothetical protein